MLTIRSLPGAPLEVNCYLVADTAAREAIIIDAPQQVAETLGAWTEELGVQVTAIVCTHGHWDHSMGLPELLTAFAAPVACHTDDADLLEHPTFAPFSLPFQLTPVTPDRLLEEDDLIEVGTHSFTVLNTPGHTPGCICLYSEADNILFSGDTLFAGTYGRTDFPGGSVEQMVQSLTRLRALPGDTTVYPGHGPATTIARETWLQQVEEMDEG